MIKYIYVGISGYNPRIGKVKTGQEFDIIPDEHKDELIRNGLIKIKSDKQPKPIKIKNKEK